MEEILNFSACRSALVYPTNIQPWDHQLALVQACMDNENNVRKIALVDRPGAGKTNVVLGIVLAGKKIKANYTTVIVVPHNILSQWTSAISTFSNDLSFVIYDSYASVLDLHQVNTGHDIALVNSLYFSSIAGNGSKCHRLVFDEVDSINTNFLRYENHMDSHMTYYVSATTKEKFQSTSGVVMISCESAFLDASTSLPDPETTQIVLKNVLIDRVLNGVLTTYDIGALNAFAYGNLTLNSTASSVEDVIRIILEDSNFDAQRSRVTIHELEEKLNALRVELKNTEVLQEDTSKILESIDNVLFDMQKHAKIATSHEDRISMIRERMYDNSLCPVCYSTIIDKVMTKCCKQVFCSICIQAWRLRSETCPMCREMSGVIEIKADEPAEPEVTHIVDSHVADTMPDLKESQDKISALESLVEWRQSHESDKARIIVFSSFDDTFKRIREVLTNREISYVELDGGNVKELDAAINDFKFGRAKVLLVNAHFYCAGMNLEFATDIIFMHKMAEATERQVVGRAQRPGRSEPLKIWYFLHRNEVN